MKKMIMTLMLVFTSVLIFAQSDPIIGKWQNPSGEGRIEIYKKGEKYFGKLYWLKEPNDAQGNIKKDIKNPDKSLQSRQVQGLEILTNFSKDGNVYQDGKIYDPKTGKTYSCKMTLQGTDKLDIRGYVGVSLFGRTESWKRVN
ncbi:MULTISPECIES: DUF2147 domain-containing protein [Sphingobacterium]|uniref:DUF2147 domain-containing protein n=2 Tax=Sphingobacterium TaxID=28453 RepID=A0ABW5YRP1_9SPHI|nr:MULTISPECIES: DUF2147 domain-containing protein [unclassified Sphingobacterium]MBB2953266.1 uncharacterized protein (DUF2147 family) [Sphingobacterium sp. JUb56]MCS3555366.1 uncharacterized protein (DUF2147 family) [Sphingobacterium sp. JUb21]QQD15089.1 DUF2147 domain-containing protein [Sphingobacterium sp. UDSM-2020]TCR03488.1 uncharacterized protein DUF2147 [Sphingobacterium sp. JUb20]